MDYAQLRNLLEPLVTGLKDTGTHTMPAASWKALPYDRSLNTGRSLSKLRISAPG
jgi:hypothetical protein